MGETDRLLRDYPPGVVSYTKNFGEQYDGVSKLRTMCLHYSIPRELMLLAVAEACYNKLLRVHDVVLSALEIGDALASAAVSAYIAKRVEELEEFSITPDGKFDYVMPQDMENGARGLTTMVLEWADAYC
jgi:hypothetical protein